MSRTLKGKVKKGFAAYCAVIMVMTLMLAMPMTAFAAGNDPLTVVNNLSDFIFGLIRAIGLILLGFGIVQVGLSLKSHDPLTKTGGVPPCMTVLRLILTKGGQRYVR